MTRGLVMLALLACAPTTRAEEAGRILVLPFENVTRDGRIFWLTEAAAVLLTDDLNNLYGLNGFDVHAITRQERRAAFDRLQVPPAAALTDATRIRIGQIVGATQVVLGSLRMEDNALVVRARSIALDTGRVQAEATEHGPLTDLFAIFERVAWRLTLLPTSPAASAGSGPPPPPVAAFEDFVKGLLASTPATAIGYFTAALQRHPAFDRARLALWDSSA
jgi:TolB-like protein